MNGHNTILYPFISFNLYGTGMRMPQSQFRNGTTIPASQTTRDDEHQQIFVRIHTDHARASSVDFVSRETKIHANQFTIGQ